MSGPDLLPPDEAARRFAEDPASVNISLPEICRAFGLTWAELRAELVAGRITASGTPTATGYADVAVSGVEVLRWMAATGRRPLGTTLQ